LNTEFDFFNYKETVLTTEIINNWLKYLPIEKLINKNGTTFRSLTDAEKNGILDIDFAINLMIKNPSIIKRPVIDFGNNIFYLGFNESEITSLIHQSKN
jgi:arsenate reductase